jgi:predicted PurR-regulated permease PerM
MLGVDRHALKAAWTVFLFALMVVLVYLIRDTLMVFALALFLAHLLAPAVDLVASFVPRRVSRTATLGILYLLTIAAVVALLIPIGSKIGEQAASLAARLPEALKQDPLAHLPLPGWLEVARPRLTDLLRARMEELEQDVLPLLSRAGEQILLGLGSLLSLILVPILSFFFVKDGASIRQALVDHVVAQYRPLAEEILDDLHRLLVQYIRALVLLAGATFVSHSVALAVMGVPYSFLLAGIAAILEFIPVLGPLAGAVILLTVSAFTGYPHLLWIVVFLAAYRVFQDYVLSPYLMSSGVEIHPLLVLFGVLAGERVAGIPGMFFSVPVIAALRVILVRLRRVRRHA